MMTDEEMARADAEYDAQPGTPPDFYSFRSKAELGDKPWDVISAAADLQRSEGATFWRATDVREGVWIEGWLQQPAKQAPFDPPYTLALA